MKNYEVIVIGGGAVGLATAAQLAKNQKHSLLIEQSDFLNQEGSSAGMSRQFRLQYAEKHMTKLVVDSIPYWQALQKESDEKLIDTLGSLWFGDPEVSSQEGSIPAAMKTMDELNIEYESLKNAEAIEQKFPFRNLPENYCGFFQKDGGIINLEATLKTLHKICKESDYVDLMDKTAITNIQSLSGGEIIVTTDQGDFKTKKLVMTPGIFINEILSFFDLKVDIKLWEMSSAYYIKTEEVQYPVWFVFQAPTDERIFYGFPDVDWAHPGYFRVSPDIPDRILKEPSQRKGQPSARSLDLNKKWIRKHMKGLSPESEEFTSSCMITLSNTGQKLMLDRLPATVPNHENIFVYTAGWAAKYIPLLGKILADLAVKGKTEFDISHFTIDYQATKKSRN